MKYLVLAILLLAGCYTLGDEKHEPATVSDIIFTPSTSGSGFTSGGHVVFTSTAEAYSVVFQCQHGRFVVGGDLAASLWNSQLKKGQAVDLIYKEKLNSNFEVIGFKLVGVR